MRLGFITPIFAALMLLTGCELIASVDRSKISEAVGPVLLSVAPESGEAGDTVVLAGTGLGDGSDGVVLFGSTEATASAWSDSSVEATVPAGLTPGSLQITVKVGETTSNELGFTVLGTDTTPACTGEGCDTTAPDTAIDAGPAGTTNLRVAQFTFSSPDADVASYECALDAAPFAVCASPKGITGLTDGSHSFAVRAIDASGNTDASPAERAWTVDTMALDDDGDGLTNGDELDRGTDPSDSDSDNDGLGDGVEVGMDLDPLDMDTDGDSLSDGDEVTEYDTDPLDADSDADLVSDGDEITEYGSDPTDADSDDDGLDDGVEVQDYGTDPITSDTDSDGLTDIRRFSSTTQIHWSPMATAMA